MNLMADAALAATASLIVLCQLRLVGRSYVDGFFEEAVRQRDRGLSKSAGTSSAPVVQQIPSRRELRPGMKPSTRIPVDARRSVRRGCRALCQSARNRSNARVERFGSSARTHHPTRPRSATELDHTRKPKFSIQIPVDRRRSETHETQGTGSPAARRRSRVRCLSASDRRGLQRMRR